LQDQLERGITKADFNGLGQVGQRDRSLDLAKEALLHPAGTQNDVLHRTPPLALVLESHENHPEVRLSRTVKAGGNDRAIRVHLWHRCNDSLGLSQLSVG